MYSAVILLCICPVFAVFVYIRFVPVVSGVGSTGSLLGRSVPVLLGCLFCRFVGCRGVMPSLSLYIDI